MVTASGNFWGSLSFNGREVFFTSSFEPEDGHKDDSAAVNLVQQSRMRRRRWTLSSVCAIYLRRYRLRDTAMEIFFRRGKITLLFFLILNNNPYYSLIIFFSDSDSHRSILCL